MKPSNVLEVLRKCVIAGLPVLVKGPPGVGKTDLSHHAASLEGADFMSMHPVVSDPTDFKGIPGFKDGIAGFYPYGDLLRLIDAKKKLVCLIDDIGQAPQAVQAAVMQLLLARRVNDLAISKHVTFIAATNRREDRAGVTGILEPVKSRFATIIQLDPNLNEWCDWALLNGVMPELVAFVRFRPDLFLPKGDVTADIVNRPSPRTITNFSKVYKAGMTDVESLAGAAGEGFANEFVGFLPLVTSLPKIVETALVNPGKAEVPAISSPAILYAVATALASRADAKNITNIVKYMVRLPKEFSFLGIRDTTRRFPAAQKNAEYIEWAIKNQNFLV